MLSLRGANKESSGRNPIKQFIDIGDAAGKVIPLRVDTMNQANSIAKVFVKVVGLVLQDKVFEVCFILPHLLFDLVQFVRKPDDLLTVSLVFLLIAEIEVERIDLVDNGACLERVVILE